MQSEDSINKYRFPKTLSEQRRFLGLPYDEAIPTFIPLAWGLYAGSQMLGICAAALIWFSINTAKKRARVNVALQHALLVFPDHPFSRGIQNHP